MFAHHTSSGHLLVGQGELKPRTDGSFSEHFRWRICLSFGFRECNGFLICRCKMAMLDTNMPICCDRCIRGGRGASEIPVLAWHHWPLVDEFPQSPNHPKCFGLFFPSRRVQLPVTACGITRDSDLAQTAYPVTNRRCVVWIRCST